MHAVSKRNARRTSQLLAYALLLVSCEDPLGPDSRTVGRLEIQPAGVSIAVGASASLRADVFDSNGERLAGRRVFWSSQNLSIAAVSQTGTVTGVAPGMVAISANSGGKSALANVTVTARPVSSVRVTPTSNQLTVGSSLPLMAEALDAGGLEVTGKVFAWSSTNTAIVTVSSTGVITALAPGNATITASVDGVSGSATVTAIAVPVASVSVSPASGTMTVGDNVQLRATPLDASGNVLTGRPVEWGSSDNAVATVTSTGLVVGLSPGRATIAATIGGISGSATITVTLVPIGSISITPAQATIAAGGTVQFTATPKDANGNVLVGRDIAWTSDQPSIATVSGGGVATGVSQGVARITAESEGKTAVALVTVTPVAISSIDVTPATVGLALGGTTQLTATPRDARGQPLLGRVITWITGAPSVATVSQTGMVTAVGTGSAIVFAASEGVSGSAAINVSSVAVAKVIVAPAASNITVGGFVQLTAETRDAQDSVLTGRTVQWTSSNQSVAVVSGTGRVQSVSAGTVTITATSEGVSGSASVTIGNVPVSTVQVTPTNATLVIGQITTFLATPRDAHGNVLTGRVISWESSNPAVATVSTNGTVTAISPGSTQLTATCESIFGTASVTVTNVPVASVTMTPSTASLTSGQTQQMTVTVKDASGKALPNRTVSFTSSSVPTATVSPSSTTTNTNGQAFTTVTAVGTGASTITATSGGLQATATITVTVVPIASVTVTPGTPTVEEGQSVQLTATARDANNVILPGRTIVWASSNPSISVSQSGMVTAVVNSATQTATITASAPNAGPNGTTPFGTVTVTVTYAPVASVTILPSPAVVTVNGVMTLSVTLKDAANNTLNPTGRIVTWASQNTSIVTVSPGGAITGIATGQTTVTADARSPGQATAVQQVVQVSVSNVPVASVTISPSPATIHVGALYQVAFSAVTRDAGGAVLPGRQVVWGSSNPAVLSIDALSGVAVGVSTGSATVTATSEGVPGTSSVTVDLVPVATVVVMPGNATLTPPQTVQLAATPKDSAGNDITGVALGARSTSWNSSNASAATVSATGLVTSVGLAAANVTITATVGGTNGVAAITVLAPVASVTLTPFSPDSIIAPNSVAGVATVLDAATNPLAGRLVSFTSSLPSRGAVTASGTSDASGHVSFTVTGVAAAAGPATVNITATSEAQTSPAEPVKVLNPVATVALTTPTDSLIGTGGTIASTVVLHDAFANTIAGRPISYTSSNPAVATVSTTGVITAVSIGTATITATSESKSANVTVRILPPVATVSVTAPADSLGVGQSLQATATLKDASNGTIVGRPIAWSSASPSIATVHPTTGLITAVAIGNSLITATSEGQQGSFTVRVIPALDTIALKAFADSLIGPGTIAVTATALDAAAAPVPGRLLTVSSSNPAAATVLPASGITDASGSLSITVTHVSAGTSTISASGGGKIGTLVLRMLAPVATVTLTAPSDSLVGAGSIQTAVTLRDAANNTITGRPIVYTSSDPLVATVSPTGLVTGVATGNVTITATSEGKSGSVALRMLASVASVTIASAAGDSVLAGFITVQTSVVLRDAASNILTGRPISYASSNASLATVSAGGLVSAAGSTPGTADISATSEGVTSATPLAIRILAPVDTVIVTAPDSTVPVGNTVTATATLLDASSNTLTGRPVSWSSSAPSVASVGATTGLVTALAPGQTDIVASVEGKTGMIQTFRSLGPLDSVTVVPATVTVAAGSSAQITATALDAATIPNSLPGINCSISSSNAFNAIPFPLTGTTNAKGQIAINVFGLSTGTAKITVTCGGKSAHSDITVTP
ncbi:MAG: hypothetical protein MNPFHGCM_00586 [Gemmatimonadaceae bacterium]|nr:hypothetical protein [Gemmatimonadaceae bacterium]